MSLKVARQILALRPIQAPAFYRQEDHPLRLQKERHSESHCPGRFWTAIPGDYDRLADWFAENVNHHVFTAEYLTKN